MGSLKEDGRGWKIGGNPVCGDAALRWEVWTG